MTAAPLRVAVLGGGTVGGATALGLITDSARPEAERRLAPADGRPLTLHAIADKFVDAAAARGLPRALLTTDAAVLMRSPDVDAVVETIGGDEPARTFIAEALDAGKGVVTANKHVIAHHGPELEAIARRSGAPLRFEASVGGGIPVLGPLAADLAGNRIDRFRGIVNGTTNYILTAMTRDGASYGDVLALAQKAGYAEADPSGDVEGADAVNKLVILVRLAFGAWIRPEDVVVRPATVDPTAAARPGITGVGADTIAGATALGFAIKLLAEGRRVMDTGGTGRVSASVLPTALPLESPLARTDGVLNRIELIGEPIGTVAFEGPGAGGPATSSAVIGDLLAIARGAGSTWAGLPPAGAAAAGWLRSPLEEASVPAGRDWFAAARLDAARLPVDSAIRAAELDSTVAVHLRGVSLGDARAILAAAGAAPTTPIYPAEAPR